MDEFLHKDCDLNSNVIVNDLYYELIDWRADQASKESIPKG
jgi:hypothetical protein